MTWLCTRSCSNGVRQHGDVRNPPWHDELLVYLLHQYGIARQASGELHIKMRSGPVHKLMAAEMAVAAEFYHGMRPFLMDEFNDSAQYAEYVQGLVAPSWPEQRKYKLAVHPVENNHRHIVSEALRPTLIFSTLS